MGLEPFRRLLNDPRFAHASFIAETPVDEDGDEERNVRALKSLLATESVGKARSKKLSSKSTGKVRQSS